MKKLLDLYTDYLLSNFSQVTCTSLSRLLDESHFYDTLTRLLSTNEFTSKDLWAHVKPLVREYQSVDACLIFDDTIISKPDTAH
jgi:hypothetical protein